MAGRTGVMGGFSPAILIAASMLAAAAAASHGAGGLSAGILRGGAPGSRRTALRGAGLLRLRGGEGGDVLSPTVWWSQREASLFLKVDMPPGMHKAEGLAVGETALTWDEGNVKLNLELSAAVNVSSARVFCDGGRQATVHVSKAEKGWWPRLTTAKANNVKVDWATWKDEDEVDEEEKEGMAPGMGGDGDFNYDDLAGMDLEGLKGAADKAGASTEGEEAAMGGDDDMEMHDDAAGDAAGEEEEEKIEEMKE